jgi:hypothetical protein
MISPAGLSLPGKADLFIWKKRTTRLNIALQMPNTSLTGQNQEILYEKKSKKKPAQTSPAMVCHCISPVPGNQGYF